MNTNIDIKGSLSESVLKSEKEYHDKLRDDLTPRFSFDDEGIYLSNGCYKQMVISREVLMDALKEWSKEE